MKEGRNERTNDFMKEGLYEAYEGRTIYRKDYMKEGRKDYLKEGIYEGRTI